MKYWPIGNFFDATNRLVGKPESLTGYKTWEEANSIVEVIQGQQTKSHHVDYCVESAVDLKALQAMGVLI